MLAILPNPASGVGVAGFEVSDKCADGRCIIRVRQCLEDSPFYRTRYQASSISHLQDKSRILLRKLWTVST